jgi:hypothetical protein
MPKPNHKSVEYAYPTSPHADEYNNGEGCWMVYDGSNNPPTIFQEGEYMEAVKFYLTIDALVDTSSCHYYYEIA